MYAYLSRDSVEPGAVSAQIGRRELARYPEVELRDVEVTTREAAGDGDSKSRWPAARARHVPQAAHRHRNDGHPAARFRDSSNSSDGRFFNVRTATAGKCAARRWPFTAGGGAGSRWRAHSRHGRDDIVLCTDGRANFTARERRAARAQWHAPREKRIDALEGRARQARAHAFSRRRDASRARDCSSTRRRAPQSTLADSLGCRYARHGGILCGQYEATSVPGVFVAGNILRDVQLSIVAAAEGARAAFGINRALTREDFEQRATGTRRIEHPSL